MFSPFQKDLSELTINELEAKIAELTRKYHISNNSDIQSQIATFIDIYKVELQSKIAKQNMNQQQDQDSGLDNLINIS